MITENIILTIDFDIIMAPSIQYYNDLVPKTKWSELLKNPYNQLALMDTSIYQRLTNQVMDYLTQLDSTQIHFIRSHEQVYNYLSPEKKYTITNIDHHHDMGYSKKDCNEHIESNGCANWVQYIYSQGQLNQYTWIHNDNSIKPDPKLSHILTNDWEINHFNLNNLFPPDLLIICLSEPWVPPMYRNLFFLWMDLCNKYYNIHFELE